MKTLKILLISAVFLYGGLSAYVLIPQKTIPVQELAGNNSRFITVDGRSIQYEKYGQGKPVILVHGFAGSTYTWRKLIPLLARTHTVYAYDLPGFGLSDKSPGADYTLRSQAATLLGLMKALGLQSASLVGHSMGGVIVGIAAAEAPHMVDRLVLVDAGFYHGRPPSFVRYLFFPLNVLMARSFYTQGTRARSLQNSFYDKSLITQELIANYLKPAATPDAAAALASMMNGAAAESYDGITGRIATPTLILWARQDNVNPLSDGDRLQGEISGARLVVIEKSGHMVQEEKPSEVAAALREFLQ